MNWSSEWKSPLDSMPHGSLPNPSPEAVTVVFIVDQEL